ncbi:MAG TPA: zinc-binding dehydrogenase, partial [Jatrophihabitans sp.]|nr:zinc-binding dehydrogenase [Jatrophihabitans sp.]
IKEEQLPMILGCDAAGVDESTGAEVVVHAVINTPGWTGDDTLDPGRTLLSEKHQGSLADYVVAPRGNVIPKPAELSFEEAACLPTAWLTAYRMLFVKSGLQPGQTVLVQGASGGVASACIAMARAAGYRVYATARTEAKQQLARELGAHEAFGTGARLPERVDAVLETVGEATWSHSAKSLKPGGRIVISGATSGFNPPAELNRFFFLQLQVVGSTMGTKAELADLIAFLQVTGLRPRIDRTIPIEQAADGLAAMESGDLLGKIVLQV